MAGPAALASTPHLGQVFCLDMPTASGTAPGQPLSLRDKPVSLRDKAVTAFTEVGGRALHATESWLLKQSLVPTTPFLPLSTFDWVARAEAAVPVVQAELEEVLSFKDALPNFQDISVDQASISKDDGWKTFFFLGYGFRSDANCKRCPQTAALLDSIPGLVTGFFSILAPGKRIPPHRGPWRGVLRYHLALKVPSPASAAGIRVGGEEAHWEEGKSLLFDDGYPHEAWNETGGVRVVLFCDVLRPLRSPAAEVNRAIIKAVGWSPYIQDARSRHEAWEKRAEAMRWGTGN
ncbi:MAG TPA: aspartyl/asparaginyl beta-hydroxylase domain-containing protein [Acidimicrobiales bacterium]|nr:aspartyl/asparaginyl beta-hydroxylase domain-containing protein [Acidimicrobiales bacterium]